MFAFHLKEKPRKKLRERKKGQSDVDAATTKSNNADADRVCMCVIQGDWR
jgi:histidyl-tRNA synthetase